MSDNIPSNQFAIMRDYSKRAPHMISMIFTFVMQCKICYVSVRKRELRGKRYKCVCVCAGVCVREREKEREREGGEGGGGEITMI